MDDVNTLLTNCAIENMQTLLIDCDGVLYTGEQCTDQDIKGGLDKTLDEFHIPREMFPETRAALKEMGIRGLFNSVLDLCYRYRILFDEFAEKTMANTDYSKIPPDPEMLDLLKKVAKVMPVCIVTNNTSPHLKKIFERLRGEPCAEGLEEELGIKVITIEDTLYDDPEAGRKIFHPKQKEGQFTRICSILGQSPAKVGILDDTERIRKKAWKQGLVPIPTNGATDTKNVLKQVIEVKGKNNEKSNIQVSVFVR